MKIDYLSNGDSQNNEEFMGLNNINLDLNLGFGQNKEEPKKDTNLNESDEEQDQQDEWNEIFDEYFNNNGLGRFSNVENFKNIVISWPKLGSEKFTDNEKFSDNEEIGKSIEDEVVDHNNGWAHLYETYFRKNQPNTTTEQFTNDEIPEAEVTDEDLAEQESADTDIFDENGEREQNFMNIFNKYFNGEGEKIERMTKNNNYNENFVGFFGENKKKEVVEEELPDEQLDEHLDEHDHQEEKEKTIYDTITDNLPKNLPNLDFGFAPNDDGTVYQEIEEEVEQEDELEEEQETPKENKGFVERVANFFGGKEEFGNTQTIQIEKPNRMSAIKLLVIGLIVLILLELYLFYVYKKN